MRTDETFGASTVAPTLIESDQRSGNVTPATLAVYLDWRTIPTESVESLVATLRPLVAAVEREIDGITGKIEIVWPGGSHVHWPGSNDALDERLRDRCQSSGAADRTSDA
ncbi:MAG: hypothetical protein KatS3mg059_1272 [Thermomicrobiales bacterium]|nr:MAG: hypothetical protein KatS3mg059_1272 [Thermomicrobiales bacterium]